jgi:hypothetical protein
MRVHAAVLVLVLALLEPLACGCASIPREAPILSGELGTRIQETRSAHKSAVRLYLDAKRTEVNEFVDREWVPQFTTEVFGSEAVASQLERVLGSGSASERGELIVGLGQRVQTKINAKRRELLAPLDEAELAILRRLDEHYDQMLSINLTLTALLDANAKASQTQDRLLKILDAKGELPSLLEKAEEMVSLIVEKRDAFAANKQRIEELIRELKRSLP